MEVHGDDVVGPRHAQHVGHQLGRDGSPRFVFFILSGIRKTGNNCGHLKFSLIKDTNLVWDSATQSGTGHKSGTSNVYPLSNITKR